MAYSPVPSPLRTIVLVMTVGLTAGAPLALAQTETQAPSATRAQFRDTAKACKADIHQFCPDVRPGGGRVLACLHDNADKVSKSCQDAMAQLPPDSTPGK